MVGQNIFQSGQNTFVHSSDGDSFEDYDFSDVVLKYINDMLMEEDMEDKASMFRESAALHEAEKSFYDVLGQKYPTSSIPNPNDGLLGCGENHFLDENNYMSTTGVWCPYWLSDPVIKSDSTALQNPSVDVNLATNSSSSYCSLGYSGTMKVGLMDSPESTLNFGDGFSDGQSLTQYQNRVKEAWKFLSGKSSSVVDVRNNGFLSKDFDNRVVTIVDPRSESYRSRGKKNVHDDDGYLQEGRSNKQSALYTEPTVRTELLMSLHI